MDDEVSDNKDKDNDDEDKEDNNDGVSNGSDNNEVQFVDLLDDDLPIELDSDSIHYPLPLSMQLIVTLMIKRNRDMMKRRQYSPCNDHRGLKENNNLPTLITKTRYTTSTMEQFT